MKFNKLFYLPIFVIAIIFIAVSTYTSRKTTIKVHLNDNIEALVNRVVDGNTIFIIDNEGKTLKVRLANIDVPKKDAVGANECTRALFNLLINKKVSLVFIDKDKYNVNIARIYLNKNDISYLMIANGYAKLAKRYARKYLGQSEFKDYGLAEKYAKKNKLGLWSDPKFN